MKADIEDWKNGWFGIELGIAPDEIDRLCDLLQMLKKDQEQHFHISSDYKGTGGIGDITVFISIEKQQHNMMLFSRAMAPGEEIKKGN